jgi:hypothetical protein
MQSFEKEKKEKYEEYQKAEAESKRKEWANNLQHEVERMSEELKRKTDESVQCQKRIAVLEARLASRPRGGGCLLV